MLAASLNQHAVHHWSEDSSLEEVGGERYLAFNGEDSTEDVPDVGVGSPPANKMRERAKRYQFHDDMYQHEC